MANEATTIADQIVPQIWTAYAQENLPRHSTIQAAGKVEINTSPDVIGGDEYTREPKHKPLTSTGASEQIVANTNVGLENMISYSEYGVIVRRAKGWAEEDLVAIATGSSPMQAAQAQFTEYWAREIEVALGKVLIAAFASSGALVATHQLDKTGVTLTGDHVIDAQDLLEENSDVFDSIMMHSSGYNFLKKLGLIDWLDAGTFGEQVLRTGSIPAFMGMQVIINNAMCPAVSAGNYPFYLMGGQPFRLSYQRPVRMERDRDIRLAAGTEIFVSSVHFAPHIKGMSYSTSGTITSTKNPTNAELDDAAKWEKVATNNEDIRLVQLIAKTS